MTAADCPVLCFNTAGALGFSADSTLRGRAVRGFHVAQALAARLPSRAVPEDRIPSGLPFFGRSTVESSPPRKMEKGIAQEFFARGDFRPGSRQYFQQRIEQMSPSAERELQKIDSLSSVAFPDSYLSGLFRQREQFPGSLSVPEELVVEQVLAAVQRIPGRTRLLEEFKSL